MTDKNAKIPGDDYGDSERLQRYLRNRSESM